MHLASIAFTITQVFTTLFIVYAIIVLFIILLDNRMPATTFAWLFLMIGVPLVGLLVYLFFGREFKVFSNERKLARIGGLSTPFGLVIKTLKDYQAKYVEKLGLEKPSSYRQKLMNLIQLNSPSLLTIYNRVEILRDAKEKYPRLLEDVRRAQTSIHLLYYIWTEDEFTLQLKDALIERAHAGVKVRALADASTLWVSKQYLRDLREAGIQLLPYRPFMSIYTFHTLNYRNHRKIVVIDGQIGFVGGMNLDKEQLHNKSGFWRDTHLRIVGEAVQALQASFAVSWYNTTQEKIVDEINFPSPNLVDMPLTPVQVTFGGPDSQWRAMQQLYFMMIMSANKKVQIQSPFFIPDLSLLEAIKAAALSGIQVEIMCTKWGTGTDFPLPYYAANTYFADVVRAGARVFLYKKGYMHCKTIGIDEQVCAIGTANFDIRSFYLNYETMTVIYDDQLARELAGHFQEDLLECEEFLLEEYLERPVLSRLRDSICRLGSPIM